MGAIGGLLGLSGGVNGTGLPAPQLAGIVNPTSPNQTGTAYNQTQDAIGQQQALLQALQAQNGIQNQSQVYGQLQGVANGTGPNPAQAMLNQATGANVANQAALMAGQRGASQNVGLMARQAAQQGANTQQQAVGQGATLQANQSLNAIGAAGNMANTQAANQIGATAANTGATLAQQQNLLGAQGQFNNALVSNQGNVNSVYGQLANTTMQGQQATIGGILNGLGGAASSGSMAEGGEVQKFDDGGGVQSAPGGDAPPMIPSAGMGQMPMPAPALDTSQAPMIPTQSQEADMGISNAPSAGASPLSSLGQFLQGVGGSSAPSNAVPSFGADSGAAPLAAGIASAVSGGKTNQSSSGGGGGMGGLMSLAAMFNEGGNVGSKLKSGGHVPGKPKVPGNSYKNDTVKALLSPGEVVIPNSVMQSRDPVRGAAQFVQSVLAKKRMKNG